MNGNSYDKGCGILIIDDHAISRHITFEALRIFSSNIKKVQSGFQAKSITRNWFPRLIFTDIHLPDICGISLVKEIRSAWPQKKSLPHIVVITGDHSADIKRQAKRADVAAILLKPVLMEDIRTCAVQLIRPNRTVQENSAQNSPDSIDQNLRKLFTRELTSWLPMLDQYISQLNWEPACEILHKLIASSAICREKELEHHCRSLYRAITGNPQASFIAQAYIPFLQAAAQTKMHLQIAADSNSTNEASHLTNRRFQPNKNRTGNN